MQDKMMNELKSLTTSFMPAIEAEMRDVLGASGGNPSPSYPFYGMIHYHMGWANEVLLPAEVDRGKRIRPILCLLACAAAGADWQVAVPAAAAVEILHNFSLVHDDIEDVSPTRRGRPTLWTIWGQAQAINTGDAMFAMSHLAISRLLQRGVEPEVVVRALRRFDETCVELTRGQYIDMSFEARDTVSVADYVEMITGKTAVLVALCAELGALIAGADDDRVRCFSEYGLTLAWRSRCKMTFSVSGGMNRSPGNRRRPISSPEKSPCRSSMLLPRVRRCAACTTETEVMECSSNEPRNC